jgi:hypothetical protein
MPVGTIPTGPGDLFLYLLDLQAISYRLSTQDQDTIDRNGAQVADSYTPIAGQRSTRRKLARSPDRAEITEVAGDLAS